MLSGFLLASVASAMTVTVSASLPEAPTDVRRYGVDTSSSVLVGMDALQDTFGVTALPLEEELFGGMEHAAEDDLHCYAYAHGGADFHDAALLGSEEAIDTRSDAAVLAEAEELFEALGLAPSGTVELVAVGVGAHTVSMVDNDGSDLGSWVAHQVAVFTQEIDGLPTFGPGAEASVVTQGEGVFASFSHAVRNLEDLGAADLLDASDAVSNYTDRVGEGRYSLLKLAIDGPESVEITDVSLGYYVPGNDGAVSELVPVWRLAGTVTAEDGTTGDVLWLEPALADTDIPQHAITAR